MHFLQSSQVARDIVAAADLDPSCLVFDLGAGAGALTRVLAETGARVLAVERNPSFARRLRNRFDDHSNVRVVEADLREVPLPRRPYTVVANIPFAVSTVVLRRLLDREQRAFTGAELLVEWGFAKRVTTPTPRDLESAWWAARFDLRLVSRVDAALFAPRPQVHAAHLSVRRADIDRPTERALWGFLMAVYATPDRSASQVVKAFGAGRSANRLLYSIGVDPHAPAGTVPVRSWREVAHGIATS